MSHHLGPWLSDIQITSSQIAELGLITLLCPGSSNRAWWGDLFTQIYITHYGYQLRVVGLGWCAGVFYQVCIASDYKCIYTWLNISHAGLQ